MEIKTVNRDLTAQYIREMARRAIDEQKIFAFYIYWKNESMGWQKKAKKILIEELRK